MARLQFNKASITGMTSCYPENVVKNITASGVLTQKEAKKIVAATGIEERRFASQDVCASDLCAQAAEHLLDSMKIDRDSIDILLFMSQTPDYLGVPATACVLQSRLGLSTETAAIDLVLGCSGFVYSLSTAFAYIESGASRVLLLVGETLSKFTSLEDKSTALLFGDGASALLIENTGMTNKSFFSLRSNGEGAQAIQIPSGGYRDPANADNIKIQTFEDGSKRSGLHVMMDGMAVFDFTMEEVIKNINTVMSYADFETSDVELFVLHQSNKFMLNMFAKKLKISSDKMPISIHKYGNTSTASIPLTITDFVKGTDKKLGNTVFCGYGAGLSWGSALVNLQSCIFYDHIEYK